MKLKLSVAALAAFVLGTGCHGPTQPAPVGPLYITPASATLAVGQSQIFEIVGGHEPYTITVIGCVGGATSCVFFNIADGHLGDVAAPMTLERLTIRLVRVTFRDARLQPVHAQLYVFDKSPDVSKSGDSSTYAKLNLVY